MIGQVVIQHDRLLSNPLADVALASQRHHYFLAARDESKSGDSEGQLSAAPKRRLKSAHRVTIIIAKFVFSGGCTL